MRFSHLAAIVLLLLPAGIGHAAEQSFSTRNGQTWFNMPSGNMGCIYTPKGGVEHYQPEDGGPELQCDRQEPVYLRFFLRRSGKAQKYQNVGDVSCCGADNILRYGNSWSKDGFHCTSSREGLTCTRGKNGFSISRSKTSVY